jgi:hypothetical protein
MKTRKLVLYVAILAIVLYALADSVLTWICAEYGYVIALDSTLTAEWFEFWKWTVITGASITVVKTAKGKTNSDNTEEDSPEDSMMESEVNENELNNE